MSTKLILIQKLECKSTYVLLTYLISFPWEEVTAKWILRSWFPSFFCIVLSPI